MEWKYVVGPAIAFVLSLVAFIPLVKYRLKATEENTEQQRKDIDANREKHHQLEILILKNENDSNSKAMIKMAEALLLVAESNSKFQSIIESQTVLIQKAHETSTRAHSRLDEHIDKSGKELDDVKEKFVSHKHFDTVLKSLEKG